MARKDIISTLIFLIVIADVKTQFFDFFDGFQPLVQYQTVKPSTRHFSGEITTKRPKSTNQRRTDNRPEQTTKKNVAAPFSYGGSERGDSVINFPIEKQVKKKQTTVAPLFNFNFFTTTVKPVRKSTKNNSSRRNNSGTSNYNSREDSRISEGKENSRVSLGRLQSSEYQIDNTDNRQGINWYEKPVENNIGNDYYTTRPSYDVTSRPVFKNNNNQDSRPTNNNQDSYSRPTNNNQDTYSRPTNNNQDHYSRPTNNNQDSYSRPTNNNQDSYSRPKNNNQDSYSRPTNNSPNTYTTKNPFYNRPGVKPAVIENRPPITNRPVTNRPVTNRPVTKRPTYVVNPVPTDAGSISFPDEDTSPEMITGPDEDYMTEADKRRYIDMAEKMCDKYKSLNMKQLAAIPLLPSPEPVEVNVTNCAPTNIPLVVGGKVVSIRDFPHMALLGWIKLDTGGYSWKCGGSLVSEQYVLTAAHCSYQERDNTVISGSPRVVQLGSSYLDDPGALVVKVAAVVRHPKYKFPKSYYDVALLKLAMPVTFSEVIKPACLGVAPRAGHPIIATGWGRTEFGGDQSYELRSVSLPIWDMNKCRDVLGTSRKLPDGPSAQSQVCAGELKGGKDTCQGDSGGPAQTQEGCVWRVVAVTSLGRSCGAAHTPGLYATVPRAFIAAQIFAGQRNNRNTNQQNNNNQRINQANSDRNNRDDTNYNNQQSSGNSNQNRNYDITSQHQTPNNGFGTIYNNRNNNNRRQQNYDHW